MRSHIVFFVLMSVLFAPTVFAAGNQSSGERHTRIISVVLSADPNTHPLYSAVVAAVKTVAESLPDHETRVSVYADTDAEAGTEAGPGADGRANAGADTDALAEAAAEDRVELVVVAGSPLNGPAARVARQHPDVAFLMIDGAIPDAGNAANLLINRREQAYLAGFIAGMRLSDLVEDEKTAYAGLLLESGVLMGETVVKSAYRLGVRAARTENDILIRRLGRNASQEELERSFGALERRNAGVILPFHYHNVGDVVEAAGNRGFDIIRVDVGDPDTASDNTLATIPVDIEETVSRMVRDILTQGPEAVATVRADFRSGALSLENDFSRFEASLSEHSREAIRHMAERLASGELTLSFGGIYTTEH